MSKPWALEKKGKKKSKGSLAQTSVKGASKWPREKKGTGPRYLGTTKAREGIFEKCRKESVGIWIAKGSMPMGTRNEESYVLSAAHNSEEKLWK